jgi:hypothetical protein
VDNPDNPEILAVVPLPSAEERKRREISMDGVEIAVSMMGGDDLSEHRRGELALVLLMNSAMDVLLNTSESDLDIRIETAKDIIRECKRVYPRASEI